VCQAERPETSGEARVPIGSPLTSLRMTNVMYNLKSSYEKSALALIVVEILLCNEMEQKIGADSRK